MKIISIFTTAAILAKMIMSEGGSLKALTPMRTPKLKADTISITGP